MEAGQSALAWAILIVSGDAEWVGYTKKSLEIVNTECVQGWTRWPSLGVLFVS